MTENSEISSIDKIGKEIQKLKKIISRCQTKNKKRVSKTKAIKISNSGKY